MSCTEESNESPVVFLVTFVVVIFLFSFTIFELCRKLSCMYNTVHACHGDDNTFIGNVE